MPIIGDLNPSIDFTGSGSLKPGSKIPFVPGLENKVSTEARFQYPSKFKAYTEYVDASPDLSQAYQDYVASGGTQNKAQWGQQHYKDFGKDELRKGAEAIEYATGTGSTAAEFDAQLKQNLIALQGNIDSDIKNMELEASKYMQKLDLQSKEKLGKMGAMAGMLGGIWGF